MTVVAVQVMIECSEKSNAVGPACAVVISPIPDNARILRDALVGNCWWRVRSLEEKVKDSGDPQWRVEVRSWVEDLRRECGCLYTCGEEAIEWEMAGGFGMLQVLLAMAKYGELRQYSAHPFPSPCAHH